MFAKYYSNLKGGRAELLGNLRANFTAVLELPVMRLGLGEDEQVRG